MKREIISLHIAVMLFGLAGVIGKFVSVPAILVTFGRVFFSSIFLLIIILIKKDNWKLKKRDYSYVIVAGIILAIHWFTFLQAIQIATVAIGTITFATFPIFVTFLEPLIYHEKLEIKNVTMAIIMFAGVLITVPEFSLANQMTLGIVVGMISAFSYAILCLFNRYLSLNYSGTIICLYEQGVATIILFPTIFFVTTTINSLDLGAIIFLGIVCTAIAHSIYVNSLKKIKVQTASIISSMESVYSIIFAFLLLNETQENTTLEENSNSVEENIANEETNTTEEAEENKVEDEMINEEELIEEATKEAEREQISDANSEIKINSSNEISLQNILDTTKLNIVIRYKQNATINVEDLYKKLNISLLGTFINTDLEEIEIQEKEDLMLGWEYSKEIEFTSEYTKVSPFSVGEKVGTIVENEISVKREITDTNYLPIKETNINNRNKYKNSNP